MKSVALILLVCGAGAFSNLLFAGNCIDTTPVVKLPFEFEYSEDGMRVLAVSEQDDVCPLMIDDVLVKICVRDRYPRWVGNQHVVVQQQNIQYARNQKEWGSTCRETHREGKAAVQIRRGDQTLYFWLSLTSAKPNTQDSSDVKILNAVFEPDGDGAEAAGLFLLKKSRTNWRDRRPELPVYGAIGQPVHLYRNAYEIDRATKK